LVRRLGENKIATGSTSKLDIGFAANGDISEVRPGEF
jgi:hypothetical protein